MNSQIGLELVSVQFSSSGQSENIVKQSKKLNWFSFLNRNVIHFYIKFDPVVMQARWLHVLYYSLCRVRGPWHQKSRFLIHQLNSCQSYDVQCREWHQKTQTWVFMPLTPVRVHIVISLLSHPSIATDQLYYFLSNNVRCWTEISRPFLRVMFEMCNTVFN